MEQESNPPVVDFKSVVPPEFQDMGLVKESPDAATFFKRVKDLNEYRGQAIRIPTSDAGPEVWAEFGQRLSEKVPGMVRLPQSPEDPAYETFINDVYSKLGRPADMSGYKLPEAPEGLTPSADAFKQFGEMAHKLNLTQPQFEALVKREMENTLAAQAEMTKAREATREALAKEWGAAADSKAALVKGFLEKFLPSAKDTVLEDFGVATLKEFASLAARLTSEGGDLLKVGNEGNSPDAAMTPAEAQQRIAEIRNNREHAYHKAGDPGHRAAVDYMTQLHRYAYGNGQPNGSMTFKV